MAQTHSADTPAEYPVTPSEHSGASAEHSGIEHAVGWLRTARRVSVLTGAGISTDSGIPDFRGPNGLWTRDPGARRMFDLEAYRSDPQLRRRAWRTRRSHPAWTALPNDGHRALVELERIGRLGAILTQNIDGLHQRAGNDPARVLELHGTIHAVECLDCGWRASTASTLERLDHGEVDPPCLRCSGILKTATISFGQALRPQVLADARRAAGEADVFLAVGSSLSVQPAASLVQVAAGAGARIVVINAEPTRYDALAGVRLRSPIGAVLPLLIRGLAAA